MSRARDKLRKMKKRQAEAISLGQPEPTPALNEWLDAQQLTLDETELEE